MNSLVFHKLNKCLSALLKKHHFFLLISNVIFLSSWYNVALRQQFFLKLNKIIFFKIKFIDFVKVSHFKMEKQQNFFLCVAIIMRTIEG